MPDNSLVKLRMIILLFVFSTSAFSQTLKIDSLESLLNDKLDTVQFNRRSQLIRMISVSNSDKALKLAEEQLQIAEALHVDSLRMKAYYMHGYVYSTADPDKGIIMFNKSLEIAKQINNLHFQAKSYYSMASIYTIKELWDKVLDNAFKSYEIAKKTKDELMINRNKSTIALVYSYDGKYELADKYFQEALQYFIKINDYRTQAIINNNIGFMNEKQRKYKEALANFIKTVELKEKINMDVTVQLSNIGLIYYKLNDLERSDKFYMQAVEKCKAIKENAYMFPSLYCQLGENALARKDAKGAIRWGQLALTTLQQQKSRRRYHEILDLLYKAHLQYGDYKNALTYQAELMTVRDSIAKVERETAFNELELKFNREEDKQQLASFKAKLDKYEDIIYYGLAIIFLGGGGFAFLLFMEKKKLQLIKMRFEREEQRLSELEKKEQELHQEIQRRNQELTSFSLNLIQKDEVLAELKEKIEVMRSSDSHAQVKTDLNSLMSSVNVSKNIDKGWNNFKLYFDKVHPDFFETLSNSFPDLTANDLKVCALLKMNLGTKEISSLMDISAESAKAARHRIRKKLGIPQEQNLTTFLNSYKTQQEQTRG